MINMSLLLPHLLGVETYLGSLPSSLPLNYTPTQDVCVLTSEIWLCGQVEYALTVMDSSNSDNLCETFLPIVIAGLLSSDLRFTYYVSLCKFISKNVECCNYKELY